MPQCIQEIKSKSLLRQSNFELLRLFSQYYIILYHICLYYVYPHNSMIIYKALQIPLHIGVVVFVLISGYFTIKPSSKGLLKFLAIFLVYSLPELFYNIVNSQSIKTTLYSLLFISKTHFWFVKTYLYLYLISPILNLWIKKSTEKTTIISLIGIILR